MDTTRSDSPTSTNDSAGMARRTFLKTAGVTAITFVFEKRHP